MPIPVVLRESVDRELLAYCQWRMPWSMPGKEILAHQWQGEEIILQRQHPKPNSPDEWVGISIAKFRYQESRGDWSLDWCDKDQAWHQFDVLIGAGTITRLVVALERDPTGVFWGKSPSLG